MARAIFGAGPYGAVESPTSLQAITRDDTARFHSTYWRPDNAVLVITGDLSSDDGFALAQRFFGDWPVPAGARPAAPDATAAAPATRTIVVDLPETGQAAVSMGLRGVSAPRSGLFRDLGRERCARRRLFGAAQ